MKLYIAGPMSGLPQDNYPAFEAAMHQLASVGYDPVSPHTVATPAEILKSRAMGLEFRQTPEYASIMQRCVSLLQGCQGVALLPGWGGSQGAQREVTVAAMRGLVAHRLDVWVEMASDLVVKREIRWTGDEECEPLFGYDGDAGLDLTVSQDVRIHSGKTVDVPCGISIELPPGLWGLLTGRSSTLRNRNLLVQSNIIDNGYRGQLFALTRNVGDAVVEVKRGERIAQLIPIRLEASSLGVLQVEELGRSERGEKSFGSTGS